MNLPHRLKTGHTAQNWTALLGVVPTLLFLVGATLRAKTLFTPAPNGQQRVQAEFARSPEWFRRCPALYIPTAKSAGAGMLTFAGPGTKTLSDRIDSFRELPGLLQQARKLGTNTIYVVDYYQGRPNQRPAAYWWHKGDYVPRSDLGGPEAFRRGIAVLHENGGRIIVYVEPFIVSKQCEVGRRHGREWSIMRPDGPLEEPYPGYWHMCAACPGWQEYLAGVCRRLVGEYGVDGIYLDSYGFQSGRKCLSESHGHKPGASGLFDRGAAEMVERIRSAIQTEKPDAVLLVEGPTKPALFAHVDGCQDWGIHTVSQRWLRNRVGQTDVFVTGWSLDDLHQALAMGHKLSLGGYWLEAPTRRSCVEWIEAHRPGRLPRWGHKPPVRRRYFAERYFRALHRWRNAGILLDAPVPEVEQLTPRRWDRRDYFSSDDSLKRLLRRLRERAGDIDGALKSHIKESLPSPANHLRPLLQARARLSPIIDDGTALQVLETDSEQVAAYLFTGPAGRAITVVNAGGTKAKLSLTVSDGESYFCDEISGQTLAVRKGHLEIICPAHSLRFLRMEKTEKESNASP